MEPDDYRKMRYVLSQPTGVRFLRMTRPIEKVERKSNLARIVVVFDLINMTFFCVAGVWSQQKSINPQAYHLLTMGFIITNCFFLATVVFYLLTVFADPGYVPRYKDF